MSLHQFRAWPCWMDETPEHVEFKVQSGVLIMPEVTGPFGTSGFANDPDLVRGEGWRALDTGVRRGTGWQRVSFPLALWHGTGTSQDMKRKKK